MQENEIFNFLLNIISIKTFIIIVIIYFLIVYIAIIAWTIKDVSNRVNSIILQIVSVFVVIIFGIFGLLIYLLIRPQKTFYEKYYEEVEGNIDILTESVLKR
ncbi:MAG: hypothetical protein Q9M94_01995, partial [Candidatus Gracilibacteria bacterium]|nr:hypothetical protein [Candidatus Gracilibacteria bacterium]